MNIVRKVINILLGIVLISGVLNAAPVSQEEAEQLVRGYMSYSSNTLLDGMVGNTIEKVDEIKVSHNNQEIVLAYVFNFLPKGWIVVTADDRMSPILGFSADDVAGDAFTNDASPVKGIMVAQLLSDYIQLEDAETPQPMAVGDGEAVVEENIIKQKINKNKSRRAKYSKYASKDDVPAPMASPLSSVSDLRVGKLLETKWTQSTTYGENYYTPKNYADGCMQTAIGQIFYYHQWPQVGIGVVRNTDGYLYDASGNRIVDRVTGQYAVTKGNTVDGVTTELSTRGGDGVGGPYKWNNMIKDSSTTPSEINKQARGALLYDIGVINGSEYSKNGTGANPSMAALMAVFDYASMRSTKIASWGTTNLVYGGEEAMLNSLNTNIDAGYPCAVTGWKVPSGSGHAVVFDGYGYQDDILYYHVNMGWGGSGDGFYHWSDFGNGSNYAVSWVYFNIFPNIIGEVISGRVLSPSGSPMPSVDVKINVAGTVVTKTTNENGIWAYAGIPSDSIAVVQLEAAGYSFESTTVEVGTTEFVNHATGQISYANCGNVWGVDFVATPASGNAIISGTVTKVNGSPLAGVTVGTSDGAYTANTTSNGKYVLSVPVSWNGEIVVLSNNDYSTCIPSKWTFTTLSSQEDNVDFQLGNVVFVKKTATGANNGSSWADAYTDFGVALTNANAIGGDVWVAAGTYTKSGTSRFGTYYVADGVSVFGGFAGNEEKVSQRNWVANKTIISGELGNASIKTDNAYRAFELGKNTLLDGLVICDYYQNTGVGGGASYVGNIITQKGDHESNIFDDGIFVKNCIIRDNMVYESMFYGFITMRNCVVFNNESKNMISKGMRAEHCTFVNNKSVNYCNGFAMSGSFSESSIYNCIFQDNTYTNTYSPKHSYYVSYDNNNYNILEPYTEIEYKTNNAHFVDINLEYGSDATPYRLTANTVATDFSCSLGWANASGEKDFAGNPRVSGSKADCGAYEYVEYTSPEFTLSAVDVSYTTASISISPLSFGGTASSASLTLYYGVNEDFSGASTKTYNFNSLSNAKIDLTGLSSGTKYYVKAVMVGSGTTTKTTSFTTGVMPVPVVSISTIKNVTRNSFTVDWSLDVIGNGSSSATVYLDYSTSSDFSNKSTITLGANQTSPTSAEKTVTGLSSGVQYYVRIRALNNNNLEGVSEVSTVTTISADTPICTASLGAATLTELPISYNVVELGTGNSSIKVYADYGITTSYGTTVQLGEETSTGAHTATLTGLTPETTYHVRVRAVAVGSSKTWTSDDMVATTVAVGNPSVSATKKSVNQTTIAVDYNLSNLGNGAASATIYVDYGTTSNFGTTKTITSNVTSAKSGTYTLTGLTSETKYYVRVRAINNANKVATSSIMEITTTAVGNPVVNGSVTSFTQRSIDVAWSVTDLGVGAASATVYVDYGTTTSYGTTITAKAITGADSGTVTIQNLVPATTYQIRIRVVNNGNKTTSKAIVQATKEEANPVFTFALKSAGYTSGSFEVDLTKFGEGSSSASITLQASTSSSFSSITSENVVENVTSLGKSIVAITGLATETTYYVRAIVVNSENGTTTKSLNFRTLALGDLTPGQGYYQAGLIMSKKKGSNAWGGFDGEPSGTLSYIGNTSYTNTMALGALTSYARIGSADVVNVLDGASYNFTKADGGIFIYEGEMWMEAGVTYYFGSNFFSDQYVFIDGEQLLKDTDNSGGNIVVQSVTPTTTGWHTIKVAHKGNGNGGGYSGGGTGWASTSTPFYAKGYGLAWNTNGYNTVTTSNIDSWKKLEDDGSRHLLRAKGTKPELVYLDLDPSFTSTSVSIPVRTESSIDGCTLTVYVGENPDAWYFEDRWSSSKNCGTVSTGPQTTTATVTGINPSAVGVWVSARLKSADGKYDCWTSPVYFERTGEQTSAPVIAEVSSSNVTFDSASISYSITDLGQGSTDATVVVRYGTDAALANAITTAATTVTATGASNVQIVGLTPGTTYYYQVVATGSNGLESNSLVKNFTTQDYGTPEFTITDVTPISFTSARVPYNLTQLGQGADSATVAIEYGLTTSYGSTLPSRSVQSIGAGYFDLSGLEDNTQYCVRITVTNDKNKTASATTTFTTLAYTAPVIGSVSVAEISHTSAKVTTVVDNNGDGSTSATVTTELRTGSATGTLVASKTGTSVTFTDLTADTQYFVVVKVEGSNGKSIVDSTKSFTTLAIGSPVVTLTKGDVSYTSATYTWSVSDWGEGASVGSAIIEIATNSNFSDAVTKDTKTATGNFAYTFADLQENATYFVRVSATNGEEKTTVSEVSSFTTLAYGLPTAPQIVVSSVSHKTASASVTVSDWGEGANGGTILIALYKGDVLIDSTNESSIEFTNLENGVTYQVVATATNDKNKTSSSNTSFTTLEFPVALSASSATVSDDGETTEITVDVTTLNVAPAVMVLNVNGAAVKTWDNISSVGKFTHTVATSAGETYSYAFAITVAGETITSSGSFVATRVVGWYDVKLAADGYVQGADWVTHEASDVSGGSWNILPDTVSALDGDVVNYCQGEGITFTPVVPSEESKDIIIEGRMKFLFGVYPNDVSHAVAGISIVNEEGTVKVYVVANGAFHVADNVLDLIDGEWVDYKIMFDLTPGAANIKYVLNNTQLTFGGAISLPISDTTKITSQYFGGNGTIGNFRGMYKSTAVVAQLEIPHIGTGASGVDPVSFGTNASGHEVFSVTIDNPVSGIYYTPFTADSLDGTFTAAENSIKATSGSSFLTLSVETNNEPMKFMKIVASKEPFTKGAPLQ